MEESPQNSLRNNSVRVRKRGFTVSQPPNQQTVPEDSPILPSAVGEDTTSPLGTTPGGTVGSATGRRRGYTLTERLFGENYAPLAGEVRPLRSGSVSSGGSGRARGSSPVQIAVRERGDSVASRRRSGSQTRRPSLPLVEAQAQADAEEHANNEVDVLEVLDQKVSTTSALMNIQGAFWPNSLSRAPVLEIDPPTPISEEPEDGTPSASRVVLAQMQAEADPLDAHLAKLLKKQKRKEFMKQTARGIWAFLKTPLGVFFAIYGILVVFWGAGLVLILVTAIPMSPYNKTLWVEIASQILTGLFTITSLLPLPWRLRDTYNICLIASYRNKTRNRRKAMGLPPLRDINDIPDTGDFWIGPGGERVVGPRPAATTAPPVEKKKKHDKGKSAEIPVLEDAAPVPAEGDRAVELSRMETKVDSEEPSVEEEAFVLTPKEEERLRKAQISFGRAQTWFTPHSTPTHHATPIYMAMWVAVCLVGNSVFQAMLCGVMWGMNRFTRPPWTTGCLIPLSFGCGIAAAVLIWRAGENTKKKREVTAAMWKLMKKDEEEFAARVKAANEERVAMEKAKKHHSKS